VRHLVVTMLVATMLAACGSSATTPTSTPTPTAVPTAVPTVAITASPSPTASPTATPVTASPSGTGAFVVAGLAPTIDVNAGPPDPSTFATSFASTIPAVYVPYELAAGLAGKVTTTTTSPDGKTLSGSFDYPASAPWAYFRIRYDSGFAAGDYREVLTFQPTGESVTLSFTVTGPSGSAASPSPVTSGGSALTLLRMATAADRSKAQPDPATFTDSFPTTASVIYVVFTLRSGLSGTVTLMMTRNGSPIIQPASLDVAVANGWNDIHVNSPSGFSAGDYAATVTFVPTGEAQTILFTVK
jgi:hypothetical protein